MRRLITLLAVVTLMAPLMFYGCSGDDGAAGPAGSTGATGPAGPPGSGVVADETCVLCHASGKTEQVETVHRIGQTAGTITVEITSVDFGDVTVDNTVPVTVNFTFAAADSAGTPITDIDLGTLATTGSNAGNLAYLQFSLAKFVPGGVDPDKWEGFIVRPGLGGSSPYTAVDPAGLVENGPGDYSYTLPDNAVRIDDTGSLDNVLVRAALKVSGIPITKFTADPYFNTSLRRPVGTAILDVVTPIGAGTGVATNAALLLKNDVSTAACNACHDPLGIHGGSRREIKLCVVCHNAKLETAAGGGWDNSNLINLVHKIHNPDPAVQAIGELALNEHLPYPQAINNCATCHQGPDADNTYSNWKNRPTIESCTSCHITTTFVDPATHTGGVRANGSCVGCHPADTIADYHAVVETPPSPNNPVMAGTLSEVTYAINSVTVDNTTATIQFTIRIDGAVANLGDNVITLPSGFNGGASGTTVPSFLFAYALPQDGISAPADYNNLGRSAGQPQSVRITGLNIVSFDNTWYTVTVPNAFPAGATMRAVALQGYMYQTSGGTSAGGTSLDNVARHTPSVHKAVTGDAVRRTVVKSGYTAGGAPEGCLECHEVFEGHGGNRVNNAQVCVMCHNPNLTTSGRTITASPINSAITALFGTDPLAYPEEANNFKELIHGLHAGEMRVNEFVDIRNRQSGVLLLGSEILYPGDLSHCTKCHVGTTYQNVQVANGLLTTVKVTTGVAGETVAQINAARASVPNATDVVNTQAASACGYCHDTPLSVSHFVAMGGEIKAPRGTAVMTPPALNVTP
jgi:OmcA/MtrC family decaheme c-type cytochrome